MFALIIFHLNKIFWRYRLDYFFQVLILALFLLNFNVKVFSFFHLKMGLSFFFFFLTLWLIGNYCYYGGFS